METQTPEENLQRLTKSELIKLIEDQRERQSKSTLSRECKEILRLNLL